MMWHKIIKTKKISSLNEFKEDKATQDIKFQSMPVSEFLAKAKKFSSQIDFS